MEISSSKRWLRVYAWVLAAFALLTAGLFCRQTVAIYQTGISSSNFVNGVYQNPVYSRETVSKYFSAIAPYVFIFLALVVVGLAAFALQRAEKHSRPMPSAEETVCKLRTRLPESGTGDAACWRVLRAERKKRMIACGVSAAVCLVCLSTALSYLLREEHFTSWELETVMAQMVSAVLPWVVVAFVTLFALVQFRHISFIKELPSLKMLAAAGKKPASEQEKPILKNGLRVAVFVAAAVLIVLGVMNGGLRDVLVKAINICTECIGLG